jgi:hypothetical protein
MSASPRQRGQIAQARWGGYAAGPIRRGKERAAMDEDRLNMSVRKFLKQVGVTSQREIERIVRERRPQHGKLKVKMVLTAEGTSLRHVVEDEIDLG